MSHTGVWWKWSLDEQFLLTSKVWLPFLLMDPNVKLSLLFSAYLNHAVRHRQNVLFFVISLLSSRYNHTSTRMMRHCKMEKVIMWWFPGRWKPTFTCPCPLHFSSVMRKIGRKKKYSSNVDLEDLMSFTLFYIVKIHRVCMMGDWKNKKMQQNKMRTLTKLSYKQPQ